MAPRSGARRISLSLVVVFIIAATLLPRPAAAAPAADPLLVPDLASFSTSVANGKADQLVGVYVPELFALPVIQQPGGQAGFVSPVIDTLTQFDWPRLYGITGILAHNHLSGTYFFELQQGQRVVLVYGDGRTERYIISHSYSYQATAPMDPYSSFIDLESREYLNAEGLFNKVYKGDAHVTFQTCIKANGNPSWGRLFVIAVPSRPLADRPAWFKKTAGLDAPRLNTNSNDLALTGGATHRAADDLPQPESIGQEG